MTDKDLRRDMTDALDAEPGISNVIVTHLADRKPAIREHVRSLVRCIAGEAGTGRTSVFKNHATVEGPVPEIDSAEDRVGVAGPGPKP
ncbi:hypothetical protein [Methylobacterium haplocladii]|nr:hypothetical protein [Methylobacterium haplocladii]GJD85852.1 hypothetical protein HPGCJGGD_3746 [Methylobacterium haplocladii]